MTEPERTSKQVIVIRKDLRMRRGKEIAQGAHASIAWLTGRLAETRYAAANGEDVTFREISLSDAEQEWLNNSFTKICCYVSSEAELRDVHARARALGIESRLIIDAGLTEFSGVPTATCVAIGPDWEDLIDQVTGNLELY